MFVKRLDIFEYDEDGWGAESRVVRTPKWSHIARSIRGLNRFTRPFVWMYLREDSDNDTPDFEVAGGDGVYAMQGLQNGEQVMFVDPAGSDELVPVWTSDQGAEVPSKHVCRDIKVVLAAAKHVCQHGTLDPSLQWGPGRTSRSA